MPPGGVDKLRTVSLDENRFALLRIPVIIGAEGLPNLVPSCPDPATPQRCSRPECSVISLTEIGRDEHFGAFTGIPGKDNGLDIEGLAVKADRVYVGLRGPVLRGWASILESASNPPAR